MPIYRPTELRLLLEQLQTGPKKHLSQNFLIDGNILQKIVDAAEVEPGDSILEIGPGPGALTEFLLQAGSNVIAVEKDPIFADALKRLSTKDNLKVFCADIMEFPLEEKLPPSTKVIANLPYHLTSPILGRLVPLSEVFTTIHVMVQEEVARRMTAQPHCSDYSPLTVFLQFYSTPTYCFKVHASCFYPAPKVDSAVVQLKLKSPPSHIKPKAFFLLVKKAFQQRRKTLKSSLRQLYSTAQLAQAFSQLNLSPQARPEELSLESWMGLCDYLSVFNAEI